jgi:hypothetical protein
METMSQITDVKVPRGKAKVAIAIALFLGVLLFMNYGAGKLADLLAFQMWPRHLNIAVFIVFASAAIYIVLMSLPFLPGIEVGLMLMAMLGVGGGIGLIAGMSRLFPFPKYLLLVCVAVTPVPLLFLLRAVQQ